MCLKHTCILSTTGAHTIQFSSIDYCFFSENLYVSQFLKADTQPAPNLQNQTLVHVFNFIEHFLQNTTHTSLRNTHKANLNYSFELLTHIFKTLPIFSKLYTQIQELHTKCISCKMKHCIQNITNTFQKQTFAVNVNSC